MRLSIRVLAPMVAAAVVLSPLLREPQSDTYPLSTFPMFATDRGAEHNLPTAVAIDEEGNAHRLSPEEISGTGEPVLASVTVARAIRRDAADTLCDAVAARVGGGAVIEVRTERYDVIDYISHDAPPITVTVHARCGDE